MIELTYQQKKEVDNLFNFVSSLVIKDNDEAAKYETLETDKLASIYMQACLGTDEFFTYSYTMENVMDMSETDNMELYRRLYIENKKVRDNNWGESFINDAKLQFRSFYREVFPNKREEEIPKILSKLYTEVSNLIPTNDPLKKITLYDFIESYYKYGYSNLIDYLYFYMGNLAESEKYGYTLTEPKEIVKSIYRSIYPDVTFNKETLSELYVDLMKKLNEIKGKEKDWDNLSIDDQLYLNFTRNFIDSGMDINIIKNEMKVFYNTYRLYYNIDEPIQDTLPMMYLELVPKNSGNNLIEIMKSFYPFIYKMLLVYIEISQHILDYSYKGLKADNYFIDILSQDSQSQYINEKKEGLEENLTVFDSDTYDKIYEEMRSFMSDYIKDGFENGELEQNNYYRILNGKPEVGVEYTFKISNLTSFKKVKLYLEDIPSLSYYDKMILIRDNPDIKFLQYILEPIPISEARIANDYYILKYNKDYIGKHKAEKFISLYYENLKMLFLKFHNSALVNQPLYKQFLRLFLIFITMKAYISSMLEDFNNVEFFDQDKVTKMFRSYDLDYFSDLPLDYQKLILKNINTLIKTSGSKEILVDIPKLFGLNNTTIYKYYLVKQTNPGAKNTDEYYDLSFAKVPVEATDPITYLLDKGNYLDYDDVISKDPYWNRSKSELIKALDRNSQRKIDRFNYRLTKYISIVSSVDLLKQTQDCNYVLHLIQSLEARTYNKNGDYTHGTNLSFVNSTYKPSGNNRISVIDGFVMLNWLILMRGQIDGISLSQTSEDESTYGAYFAKKITELSNNETDPTMKSFYTSYNVLDTNMLDRNIYNLENPNDIYRYGYEFLTDEPNSTTTYLVYSHDTFIDENGNYMRVNDREDKVRKDVQLNIMNILYSIKEFFSPESDPQYIKGFLSKDTEGNPNPAYQYLLEHGKFKTWIDYLYYIIVICNDTKYRKYGLIETTENERTEDNFLDKAKDLFGGEDNLEKVQTLFYEYESNDDIKEAVDYLLLLYCDKFASFDYNSTNNEKHLSDHIISDSTKMDAFVALYKGFNTFRQSFEQLINAEESATAYKFLKRVYYSIMVTKYQEDCFPILDDSITDRSRLSEYANYLKNKDEVFFSMVIDKINNLLPTEIGSTDNITYKKNYIDGINQIILDIIDSMENYLNDKEFDNLFNLSDTHTVDNIRFYIKQILEVFKSYTIFIHDVKVDYTFDNKFSEGVKVIMELFSIYQKSIIIENIEFFGEEGEDIEMIVEYSADGNEVIKRRYPLPKEYEYENYDLYDIHETRREGVIGRYNNLKPDQDKNLSIKDNYEVSTKYNHIYGEYFIRSAYEKNSNLPSVKVKINPTINDFKFYKLFIMDDTGDTEITKGYTPVSEEVTILKTFLTSYDDFIKINEKRAENNLPEIEINKGLRVEFYPTKEDENGVLSIDEDNKYEGVIFPTYPKYPEDELIAYKSHIYPTNYLKLGYLSQSGNLQTNVIGKIYKK